jgi:hypothetical protein
MPDASRATELTARIMPKLIAAPVEKTELLDYLKSVSDFRVSKTPDAFGFVDDKD